VAFNKGDDVIYTPTNSKGTVIRVLPNDTYTVEWDSKDLIPLQMDVEERYLKKQSLGYGSFFYGLGMDYGSDFMDSGIRESKYNKDVQCPKCGGTWKETWIGGRALYDCIPCGLKKEDA